MPSPGITVEDVDAFSDVSNGSTISVGSAASGGSGRMPRPPSGGSKRPKSAQGRRSRLAKSPYTAQQVKGSTKPLPPKPAARNMWITAMRNGNATLSTENSPMKSWAGSRSSHGKQNKTGTRTRHFSDVVQIGDSKNKSSHIRSASMSASEPLVSGGGVAYKPKEDYYDEIIELKKIINALKAENNIVNTKLRRVEGENVLKDRKMEDLLNPRKQPEDVRRTLTDKKGDTSAIVNSLKQKLHAVERTVKDKETELSQLKKEMKMTNIEELQIQSETYYQEVQRLQLALIERQQSLVREPFGSTSTPRNHSISKGRSSGFTLQQLTDENNHLRAENQGLKRDLLTAIENVSSGSKKVPLKVDYADMNRGQLLGRIHELEEQVQESDIKKAVSRKESLTEDRQQGDEFRRKGSVSKASEVPGRIELKGTTSQKLAQLQEREAELLEEREKQRSVIERLKEDRAHYRSVADDLRVKLKTTEEELVRSSGDKSAGNERRKSTSSLTSVRRSSIKESSTTENHDEDMDRMLDDFQQQRAAKTLQRQWRGYKGRQGKETERQVQDEQNQAAMTLQKNWRKHKQTAKRLEGESHEEAVTEIQAALRGHVIRRKRLETLDGDLEMADADDAIVSIQSALRAHSARTRHQEDSDNETVPRDRRTKGSSSHAQFNSEPGLYDDELGSSSDRSTSKRHPEPATSGQRRSSLTGSRRAVITAPRFSNISENSDEEDVIATSYSRAQTKTRTGGLRGLSNKHENDQRKKKNTFEIVDSDDDDDDDDDDDEDAVISRPRRSLDTGRALDTGRGFDTGRGLDTGISPQRPSLSRSNRALDPSGSSSSEATTRSPVSRPGLSRSSGRLNPSKDQEVLESSRDEGPQRPGLRSKRPLSAQRPSLTRKDKNSNGLKSTETSSTGWSRTSAGSDEDSDDDGVIVTGKKTKTAGGDGKAARPSLTRKSPAKTTPSKGGSIVNSLDNFFSSTGSSKGLTDNKSSRRRRSLLADSDDDDDDDDDDIVVSSRTKTKSKVGGKTSQLGRKDSAADLWATSDKGGGSSSKRKSSSDNSLKTSLKSTSRKTWGQEFEFEGPSRRSDSQLDELF